MDAVTAQVLVQRGVADYTTAEAYFTAGPAQLHDPLLMKGLPKAVKRLAAAIEAGEKIVVYGDYDVDGTTAVALVCLWLKTLGAAFDFYLPDRYAEGYGISLRGLAWAREQGARVVVALDCGIRAVEQACYAREIGLDLIVCDHHTPGLELPSAFAILNPKQPGCAYPFKDLSGCGIAYKLLTALAEKVPGAPNPAAWQHLVAISTACDLVPMRGENRVLTKLGLAQLRDAPSPGLAALMARSPRKRRWTVSDVVFFIGPHLNAAGRLAHGGLAVKLLLAQGEAAEHTADQLVELNTARREKERAIVERAIAQALALPDLSDRAALVLYDANWHAGVVGIVASKVVERFHKPCVLLTRNGDHWVGSARSVPGFDLYAALKACNHLLHRWGGHTHAAGLHIATEQLVAFVEHFNCAVAERLEDHHRRPVLRIDAELPLSALTMKFVRIQERLEPYGPGNQRPRFLTRGLRITYHRLLGNEHLTLNLSDGRRTYEAVGFGLGHHLDELRAAPSVAVVHYPERVVQGDQNSIRLNLKAIVPDPGLGQPLPELAGSVGNTTDWRTARSEGE